MSPIKFWPLALATLATLLLLPGAADAQDKITFPEHIDDGLGPTRSEFGEFKVNGPDAHIRGTYTDFSVGVRKDYQKLLGTGSRLKYPIILDLRTVPGNRMKGYPVRHVIINHTTYYSPNIRVYLCESLRFADLREELVRFFLLEDALGRHNQPGELIEKNPEGIIPDWLWAGVSEAIGFRENGEPSELFATVLESGKIMEVDDILTAEPDKMTSLSRAVYRASAGGLVTTLLQQDGGAARLQNFIAAIAVSPKDQEALLRKYFPGIDDSRYSLEKWWTLQAAQLAKPTSLDVLSIPATDSALAEALQISVLETRRVGGDAAPEANGGRRGPLKRIFGREEQPKGVELPLVQEQVTYDISQYKNFAGRPDVAEVLHQAELRMVQLSYRSFPLYRPLIKRYLAVIEALKEGKLKELDAELLSLAQIRVKLVRSAKVAEDVLNHYEATQVDQASGAFEEYYKLQDRLRKAKPKREDDVSKYLDRMQAERE